MANKIAFQMDFPRWCPKLNTLKVSAFRAIGSVAELMPRTLEKFHVYEAFIEQRYSVLKDLLRANPNLKELSAYFLRNVVETSLLSELIKAKLNEHLTTLRLTLRFSVLEEDQLARFQQLKHLEIWMYYCPSANLFIVLRSLNNLEYLRIDIERTDMGRIKGFLAVLAGNVPNKLDKFVLGIRGGTQLTLSRAWDRYVADIPCECQLIDVSNSVTCTVVPEMEDFDQ